MRPYMTEAEAKAKWCPLARTLFTNTLNNKQNDPMQVSVAGVNRWLERGKSACMGRGCMLWGWKGGIAPNQGVNGLGRCTEGGV